MTRSPRAARRGLAGGAASLAILGILAVLVGALASYASRSEGGDAKRLVGSQLVSGPRPAPGGEVEGSEGVGEDDGGVPRPEPVTSPPVDMSALPVLRYDAVIAGLIAERPGAVLADRAFTLSSDTAAYGADRATPVAVFPALDFLGLPSVVVPVDIDGSWARVLTPARQTLPSAVDGRAPAQTSAWVARAALVEPRPLPQRIEISLSAQTLGIWRGARLEATFPAGVGTAATPTPSGVTGYLQARYLDPAQGQAHHRVQLTSLHATAADEPYGGSDGGLIGLHFAEVASGAVSHGCVRLAPDALAAVDVLPLGTTIGIVE